MSPRFLSIQCTVTPPIRACFHSLGITPQTRPRLHRETRALRVNTAEKYTAENTFWKFTCARTLASSRSAAKYVTSRSAIQATWRNTSSYTRQRTLYTNADTAAETSCVIEACWIILNQSILNTCLCDKNHKLVLRSQHRKWTSVTLGRRLKW